MSNNTIQYAFIAGEVSKTLFGRSDLEKYDLGVELAQNYFVDFRGGLSSRPGTEFVDFIKDDDKPTWLFPFHYSPVVTQTYNMLFGEYYIRFIQDGAYVLEAAQNITAATAASPCVITSTAHGFSDGDWVKIADVGGMTQLNNRTFQVAGATTDTFELNSPFGDVLDSSAYAAYTSGGTVSRVYTVVSPYSAADLEKLNLYQYKNTVRLTHPSFAPRYIERISHTSWALNPAVLTNSVITPSGLVLTPSATGTGSYGVVVTALDIDGKESLPTQAVITETIGDWSTDGNVRMGWDIVTDAVAYNVYRTAYLGGLGSRSGGELYGFLTKVIGVQYVDAASIPDFTVQPPIEYNPFAAGAIRHINLITQGTGYVTSDVVTATGGGGSGFLGRLVVDSVSGSILGIEIISGGSGYSASPTIGFTTSTGSGATATATVSASSGIYPAQASVHQQRLIYAASELQPLTIWGSHIRDLTNFSISGAVNAADGIEFDLDAEDYAPILHLVPTRGGLITMTQTGIWLLSGGSDSAITSTNALAEPQAYNGCAALSPLKIDSDILYVEGKGSTVRLLSYNDYSKVYGGTNVSILANHLFRTDNILTEWAYAESPYNIVWGRREDGSLLAFTFVKEQNVYAWTRCYTKGLVENVDVVQENNIDTVYLTVKRYLNSRWTKVIEKFNDRIFSNVEDAWCVDCGLRSAYVYPAADLEFSAPTGSDVTVTASASVFAPDNVDMIIRAGGGKARVTAYTSGTEVTVNMLVDMTALLPETSNFPLPVLSGDWSMNPEITSVTGLWHLEGETLSGLVDGHTVVGLVVTDGGVTLPFAGSNIILGIPFTCIARTLPPSVPNSIIEHKRKNVIGASVRVHDTVGLKVGASLNNLYPMKERTDEDYDEPTRLQENIKSIVIENEWNVEGQTYYVQENPLPATILGLVLDLEMGDDNN